MSILTRDDLKTLYQEQEGVCISIYMPTNPSATETDQGRIQLKNLLAEAEKHLLAAGLRVPDAQKLLEPAQQFFEDVTHRIVGHGLRGQVEVGELGHDPVEQPSIVQAGDLVVEPVAFQNLDGPR